MFAFHKNPAWLFFTRTDLTLFPGGYYCKLTPNNSSLKIEIGKEKKA